MRKKHIVRIVIGTALILLVPLIAMRFSNDVNWDLRDFITIGALLLGAGLVFELVSARVNTRYRKIIGTTIIAAVLLIWVELAVGLFGTPFAGS